MRTCCICGSEIIPFREFHISVIANKGFDGYLKDFCHPCSEEIIRHINWLANYRKANHIDMTKPIKELEVL